MSKINDLRELSVEIARGEIGVRENFVAGHYNNRGTSKTNTSVGSVDEYQKYDEVKGEGYAWCSSFAACWVPHQVEAQTGVKVPTVRSASVDKVWADARRRDIVIPQPVPGCLGIVRANLGDRYSTYDGIHVFEVAKVFKNNRVGTIEGNSNNSGGREGYGVVENERAISSRYVWVDIYAGLSVPVAMQNDAPIVRKTKVVLKRAGITDEISTVNVYDGRPYMSARDFGDYYGLTVGWIAENLCATLNGREIPTQAKLIEGHALYPVRLLGEMFGRTVYNDAKINLVSVY